MPEQSPYERRAVCCSGELTKSSMPFTLTHVLAVVPIKQTIWKKASLSALIIGTVVPDWPLYISLSPSYQVTHSLTGLFTTCVPLGFALYLFFHIVLKKPVFELLPQPFRQRLNCFMASPLSFHFYDILTTILAIMVGAMTHIVWDTLTHQWGWGVTLFPSLNNVFFTIMGVEVRGYKLLQYGSTVVGIPILSLYLAMWFRSSHPQSVPPSIVPSNLRIGLIVSFIAIPLIVGVSAATGQLLTSTLTYVTAHRLIFECVTRIGGVFILLVGCYSLLFHPFALKW